MNFPQFQQNPIIAGLDVDDVNRAIQIGKSLAPHVSCLKVGPRLVYEAGANLIRELAGHSLVFVDCKFHDIPSTVEAAVRVAFDAGASLVTVHASNGPECLRRLAQLEKTCNEKRPFQILAVTVLTSFHSNNLPMPWRNQTIPRIVTELVQDCEDAGLSGVVCSGSELALLKEKNLFRVVPGIRPLGASADDQSRVMTPAEAVHQGASAIVIARPIVDAPHPVAAAVRILESLRKS